jgi:hypothetical protein
MPPGSECSSAMLLLRNNRRPQGNTRDYLRDRSYSGLMLAARITLAHFSIPISPIANPCCNATLKIGVVLSL